MEKYSVNKLILITFYNFITSNVLIFFSYVFIMYCNLWGDYNPILGVIIASLIFPYINILLIFLYIKKYYIKLEQANVIDIKNITLSVILITGFLCCTGVLIQDAISLIKYIILYFILCILYLFLLLLQAKLTKLKQIFIELNRILFNSINLLLIFCVLNNNFIDFHKILVYPVILIFIFLVVLIKNYCLKSTMIYLGINNGKYNCRLG